MDAEQIVHDVAEKVRVIVAEAEERAATIVREAEEDAKGIRERAEAEGRERLDEVRKAFEDLQGKLGTRAEVEPGPVVVPEPEPPPVPEPVPVPEPTPPEPAPDPEPAIVPEPMPPPDEGTPPAATNGGRSADAAGARLVAMNMALDGASREQIEAKLAEDYDLANPGEIADEVLALSGK